VSDLPLSRWHVERGAYLGPENGWELPTHYGDAAGETLAGRRAVGLIDLSHHGRLRIQGPDRVRFLNGLVTNDLAALRPGQGCWCAALTVKGRVLADFHLYARPDELLLECEAGWQVRLKEHFSSRVIREKVDFADASEELGLLGLYGPRACEVLDAAGISGTSSWPLFAHGDVTIGNTTAILARTDGLGGPGFELFVPRDGLESAWSALEQAGLDRGMRFLGTKAFEALRIEAGRPRLGRDLGEETLATEARLGAAISLTKGCYLGQEVVARTTHRGHTNRELVGLKVASKVVPPKGAKIFVGGAEVGWVTSAAWSASASGPIALGYLRVEHNAPGTTLELLAGEERLRATVTELPMATIARG